MASDEIDAYLAEIDEPARSTLEEVRRRILAVVPDAEQCISYQMPAFRVHGKVVAGFAVFAKHLSYRRKPRHPGFHARCDRIGRRHQRPAATSARRASTKRRTRAAGSGSSKAKCSELLVRS